MNDYSKFAAISPTSYADAGLGRSQFMDMGIREMWPRIPRIAGPAYTVSCPPGDNLMLHAAIYRAEPGAVIVVQAGDLDYAMSGGNVCATAQARGIAGFVIDGVIRDVAEVREAGFAVFARGLSPVPGKKQALGTLNQPITCGGVQVHPGDMVVADEEGIAVIPAERQADIWLSAKQRMDKDTAQSLAEWKANHHAKIEQILQSLGFEAADS
ncbi:RraA family protein [Leptolyngbya iicbica]|uniref:Putative 4-hydroxy-4-methyl-2-oxoglutarate aldolase n=2 Tax=Cyanophyceae TaxID=3028117 RepID=A0A4Q7EE22_9CYAN|nr:RraA family protein [Leptolyngbya sp. LK]RZM79485.1 RraA family protein [Leptolyngbya sp. LK]